MLIILTNQDLRINEQISFIISETGGIFFELEIQEKKFIIASNKYIGKIIKEMIENKYENSKIKLKLFFIALFFALYLDESNHTLKILKQSRK